MQTEYSTHVQLPTPHPFCTFGYLDHPARAVPPPLKKTTAYQGGVKKNEYNVATNNEKTTGAKKDGKRNTERG